MRVFRKLPSGARRSFRNTPSSYIPNALAQSNASCVRVVTDRLHTLCAEKGKGVACQGIGCFGVEPASHRRRPSPKTEFERRNRPSRPVKASAPQDHVRCPVDKQKRKVFSCLKIRRSCSTKRLGSVDGWCFKRPWHGRRKSPQLC
jgi:hypothetical protein